MDVRRARRACDVICLFLGSTKHRPNSKVRPRLDVKRFDPWSSLLSLFTCSPPTHRDVTHFRRTPVTLVVQAEMTRDVVLSLRARTTRHFAMAPAPARSQSGTTHASRLDDVFVWVCRMGVRVALIASPTAFVLVTLPYVARILVACVLCLCAFFAIATPCALAVAHAAWRDLDHPAPVTRFEPKCSSCDETELSKNSTLENKTAKQIRTVAVIGGGAAGIATLKQMKQQGFEVTLFEKSNDVGGLWRFGSAPGKVRTCWGFLKSGASLFYL